LKRIESSRIDFARRLAVCLIVAAQGMLLSATATTVAPPTVVWTTPSTNALGSMPLGNGDISMNAWVESSGDLIFYLGKSDSWEDNSRLAKLGRVRVKLNPVLPTGTGFTQTLDPAKGEISITGGAGSTAVTVRLWVDANHPVAHVSVDSASPVTATASFELWRTAQTTIASESSDINFNNPAGTTQVVEPDTVLAGIADGVGWYHHNHRSLGPNETMQFQDLQGAPTFTDIILGRTFGALIRSAGATRTNDQTLSRTAAISHRFDVYALTKHPATAAEWLTAMQSTYAAVEAVPFSTRQAAHLAWWADFWNRSHISITPSAATADQTAPADLTRGYALQRFITACAGRGAYPIKFNGSLFTMPYGSNPGDADYRRWGLGYWWQNTRLPYAGLCTSGDFDMMPSLFRMYFDDVLPVARYRAGHYYTDPKFDDTCFMSEVTYPWGAVLSTSYGWTTTAANRPPGDGKLQTGEWHKREWVSGLELTFMALDYYDHTGDTAFLSGKLLPAALPIIRWFDKYYTTDANGKLVMNPSQALETWWNTTNPMPEVAGLHAVVGRLLALPDPLLLAADRSYLTTFQAKIPPLPTRTLNGTTMLAAAQTYSNYRNTELPEMYGVFPFRLVSHEKPNLALGTAAYTNAIANDKGSTGWRQDDIFHAYLGQANEARSRLITRARSKDANCRFPAFWGPNFDWTPDQCHGGVLMKATQAMLLQSEGDRIFLLPAWPADWNVNFKLRAPKQTTVEGVVENGVLTDLTVAPASRRDDIMIGSGFTDPDQPGVSVNITSPTANPAAIENASMDIHLASTATVTNTSDTATFSWSKRSGPGSVTFSDITSNNTRARFSAPGSYQLQVAATVSNNGSPVTSTASLSVVISPQAKVTTTFRQGENGYTHTATFLRADNPTWNSGQRDQLLIGKLSGGQAMRTILSYDLTTIPPPSAGEITSATLDIWTLSTNSPGTVGQLQLRSLLGTPTEGSGTIGSATGDGATWNSRTGTAAWTTAGGDYPATSLATMDGYIAAMDVQKTFPSTTALLDAVKQAVANGAPLNLTILSPTTENGAANSYTRVHSDEAADITKRPRLTITYGANPNLPTVSPGAAPTNATSAVPATLGGSASSATSTLWSKVSGPGAVTFGDASSATSQATFSQAGEYLLRLTAENATGKTSADLSITVAANPGVFIDWQQIHWPGVSDPGVIAPEADPDFDGLANLAEFALGLPPRTPSTQPLAVSQTTPQMLVTFNKSRHATGVNTAVEWSDLLTPGSWSTHGVSAPTVVQPDTHPDRIDLRVTLPPGTDRRFVRLKITALP
jgi:alpha-L-fucosidase 2